ncbi:MAG TPA: L,D-transpeptidase family protein [Xanthobacteraceae bacterium]|nr:L,D-transpeptidase family protein [Xanthobacteraceae bacterium]
MSGTAGAQYYPVEQGGQPATYSPAPTAEVPAAYDPYGTSSGQGAAGAPPPGVRDPYAQPQTYGRPAAPPAPYAAGQPLPPLQPEQAGYPPGAYSGQQPAGMAPAYPRQAAPQPQAGYPAQPSYSAPPQDAPAVTGAIPPGSVDAVGANGASIAALPPEDQPEQGKPRELPPNLRHQVVDYVTKEPPGTIIIDTPNTYLYLVLPGGKAERYGIGVGRDGFTWAGTEKITKKAEWADWRPPAEMIERQPYLPRFMAGGPGNPLGARTLYLGATIYRIHGTNQPSTIGSFVSSGCIRMVNEDVENLYEKVKVGTRVVVLPGNPAPKTAANTVQPTPVIAPQ